MNAPVLLAQLSGSTQAPPPKTLKIAKPANAQALSFHLDGNTRLDFSDISSEKLTFVKVGEKLIVLFDNQSTVTIDPVFDSASGNPLADIGFQVGDRTLDGTEFAALFPIGTDQSVLPAAGGNASGPSGGANFSDAQVNGLGPGGNPLALLGDEQFGGPEFGNTDPGLAPIIVGTAVVGEIDDEGLSDGIEGGPGDAPGNATSVVNASLNLNFGALGTSGATLAFLTTQPELSGLTSGGEPVNLLISNPAGGTPTIIGFIGNDPNAPGSHVFEITLGLTTNTGEYSFTLLRPLDHSVHGTEDNIPLVIHYSATNAAGTVFPDFTVNVNDDSPDLNPEGFDLPVTLGESPVPHADLKDPVSGTSVRGGTLGILWGADSFNDHEDGGVSATTGQNGDRALIFTNTTVELSSGGTSLTSDLYSHGEQVHFVLQENGTLLVAYTGDSPTSESTVFTVKLHDTNSGSYVFTQYQELDHVGTSEEGEGQQLNLASLNLSFHYTATDSDGDPINESFSVTVGDDAPTINDNGIVAGTVDEDYLATGNVGDTYNPGPATGDFKFIGNLGVSWGADDNNTGTIANRSLAFSGVSEGAAATDANGAAILSHDQAVHLHLTTIGGQPALVGYVGDAVGADVQSNWVFTVTLDDSTTTGSYTFTLLKPIDHPTQNAEDNIKLDFDFTATDADGDTTAPSTFHVTINDDAPIQSGATITGTAAEDDLADFNPLYPLIFDFWQGSLGTSPYDGSGGDQSHTGLLGTVPVWGNLSSLVKPGADGPGEFHLVSESQAESVLAHLGPNGGTLSSHGDVINDVRMVDIPNVGEAMGFFASDGRLVFGLFVDAGGTYNFRLFDQLDHPIGDDPNTAALEAIKDTLNIDLSKFVTYTDFDKDTITLSAGTLSVNVVDDTPVVVGHEAVTANENDLANFNPLYPLVFDFWQGSLGSSPFDGATDDSSYTGLLGTVTAWGTLADNVLGGADEFGKFELVAETRANELLATLGADGGPLKSHGDVINDARMVDIPGLGEVMGFFASDGRLVFGLFVSENGIYNFRLFDQLDHAAPTQNPNGEPVADENSLNIDLSKFVTYTDYDHDTVDLGTDTFVVTVVDDIPHVTGSLTVVLDESHLNNFLVGWDLIPGAIKDLYPVEGSSGTNPNADTDLLLNTTSQQGFFDEIIGNNVVHGGADEFGKFGLVSEQRAHDLLATMGIDSKGEHIDHVKLVDIAGLGTVMGFFAGDRVVFTLTVTDAGFYDLRLFDQVDHTGANGTSLNIDLSKFVTYTDFDGDMINLGTNNLVLTVLDDAPVPVTGAQVFGTVEEEQIDLIGSVLGGDMLHGNEDTTSDSGDDHDTSGLGGNLITSNLTLGSLASLVKVGADENGTFSFDQSIRGTAVVDSTGEVVKSHGQAVTFGFNGNMLIGIANDDGDGILETGNGERIVFSVSLGDINPLDNVNNDLFTFTLLDAIDHNNPNGLSTEDLKNLDLSKAIRFTDYDGDSTGFATNSFQIKVIDDTPRQTGTTLKGTVEEEENVPGTPEMNHGNEDTANEPLFLGIFDQTTNKATGNLGSLVSVGGDEVTRTSILGIPVLYGTFSFGQTTNLPVVMSKGLQVQYALSDANGDGLNDTLTGSTADGRPVFTLTIVNNTGGGKTAGDYVFTLLDQIDHPAGGGENIANIDFSSVIRFSDYDGDTITLTSGSFSIDVIDDQPVSKGDVVDTDDVLDDEGQATFVPANTTNAGSSDASGQKTVAQGGAKSLFSIGADDQGTITITETPSFSVLFKNGNDFAQAESVQWHDPVTAADGTVTLTAYSDHYATVATLVIKIDGSYSFTMSAPVVHPTNQSNEEEVSLKFKYTVTDFDQDSVTGSLTIKVDDDTPKLTTPSASGQLDDEAQALFPPNDITVTGDVTNANEAIGTANALFTAGADGVKLVTATPTTFSVIFKDGNGLAGTEAITWSATGVQGPNGETRWIATSEHYDAAHPAATLIIRVDGSYKFTLNAPVKNDPTSSTIEENLTITIPFKVTDGDGDDSTQGTLTIKVNDDTPAVGTQTALTVDEEGLGGNPGDTYASTNAHDAPTSLASANGTLNYSFGSDGASPTTNVTFLTSNLSALGLKSEGLALTYAWDQASHTLTASNTNGTVFTLQVTNVLTGAYTFSMSKPLDHLGANSVNSEDDITIPFQFTITDGDGDTSAPATVNVTINDDAPTFTAGSVENKTVDEEGINGNPGAPDPYAATDYPNQETTASGGLGISWGADNGNSGAANRSLAFSGITEGAPVLNDIGVAITSHGAAVKYHLVTSGDTQTLIGYIGNDANNSTNYVFSVTLNDTTTTGTYNFTLFKNLDHPTANSEDDISIKFNFTAQDADKDTVAGSFKVTVDDDSPIITLASVQNGGVDEDNLVPNGNKDSAPGDLADDGTLVAHGSLGISYGADGPADLKYGGIVTETHAFNFNNGTNVGAGFNVYAYETRGNYGFTSLVGAYTAPITIKSTDGHPFSLTSVKLGLNGAAQDQFVEIFGLDANGNVIAGVYAKVSIPTLTASDTGETKVTFLADSAFNGVQVYGLKIAPVSGFSGRLYVDDLNISSIVSDQSNTIVDGPVTFSDHVVAANNISIKDSDGNNVLLSQLTSNGQPVLFKMLDALTLVAYTGAEPSGINAPNVVFSVVLSGTGSGSYDFTLKGVLDHPLHSTEDDLVFTFNYTAKDFDGDTTNSSFKVTVDDDMPVIVSPAAGDNLIVNGQFTDNDGFAPPMSWGGQAAPANSDIKGWHIAGNNLERNPPNWFVQDPADGGRVVDLDATPGNVSLSQTFNNLQNGQSYTLTFDAAKPVGYDAETKVYWNGQLVGTITPNSDHFEQFSIVVVGGPGTNTLEFREVGAADNGGTFLANVAMHATNAIVNEDSLNGNAGGLGDATGTTASAGGSLGIKWGADAGDTADAGNIQDGTTANALSDNVAALTGRAVYFTDSNSGVSGLQPSVTALVGATAITLHSAGQEVHYQILENGTKLVGYTGTFNVASQSNWVFTVSLSDEGSGQYKFNLLKPLDHPMSGSEDDINLVFGFTAHDADGDTANSTLTITVDDDTPVIAAPPIPTNLIIDGQLAGDANDFQTPGSWSLNGAIDTGGNLDNGAWTYAASNVGGSQVQVERVDSGYRGVTSSNGNPLIDLEASPGNIEVSQTVHGLTSGQTFQLSFEAGQAADGSGTAKLQVLWNGVPVDVFVPPVGGTNVYTVSLVSTGGDNVLTFREIGQAGDNTGTYLTNVSMYAANAIVDEDALNGNPGGVGDVAGANASASGILGILWGADSSDVADSGNVQDGTTANSLSDNVSALTGRAVYFTDVNPNANGLQSSVTATAATGAITLHSAGQEVHYQILENGTKLVGYTGVFDVNSQANWVFTISLSDEGAGKYTFNLLKTLDHPVSGTEDDINITFGYTARDADGDTASSTLTITVDDDTPVISAPVTGSVTENGFVIEPANASFESNLLTSGSPGVITDIKGNYTYNAPTGWTITGGNGGVFAPASNIVDAAGHDGSNVVWLREGAMLAQNTGTMLHTGDVYGVHFNLGDRTDQDFPGGVVRLIATDGVNSIELAHLNLSAPADGQWTTVDLTTGQIPSTYDGYQLRVEIQQGDGTGNQILIDDVEISHFVPSVAADSLNINWGADNDPALRTVAFNGTPSAAGLSSNGQPLHYETSGNLLKGVSLDGRTVFTLELSSDDHGTYKFTLLDNLDHQGPNGQTLPLNFSYKATDADGDTTIGNIHIDVNDQSLSVDPVATESLAEVTVNTAISNAFIPQSIVDHTLGIQWAADDANPGAGGIDRGVVLTTDTAPAGLTANGFALKYVLSDDGSTLTAYRVGPGVNPLTNAPEEHYFNASGYDLLGTLTDYAAERARVFSVSVSDNGNGNYSFTLYGNLDHTGANGTTLPLNFSFDATDADGDSYPGNFTVNIQDSVPLPSAPANLTVAESGVENFAHTISGAVGIDWNGDIGAAKHLEFIGVPAGLKSQGQNLAYDIIADGDNQKLIAYRENDTTHAPVFMVQFTEANPYYTFTLLQPLDHNPASDNLTIPFTVRATDSDGDSAEQTFNVTVTDSNPTAENVTASMFENDTIAVDLAGHYNFGTDGANATNPLTLGTAYLSGVPAGVVITTLPTISLNPDGHTVSINPGSTLDALPQGQEIVLHIPYTVTDGDSDPVTKEILVTVTGTNDAPVLDLSGVSIAGNDVTTTTVEQLPQWFVNAATITDVDSGTMASLKVTLTSAPDGVFEVLSLNTAALNAIAANPGLSWNFNAATGVLLVTGVAATSVYQAILDGLVYTNNSDNPTTTDRTIHVVVNDGISDSAEQTATLHVWAINDPPALAGTLEATVAEGGTHVITTAELGFADPDDVASGVTFIVSNQVNGVVKLDGVPSLSFTGAQLANGQVTFVHDGGETTSATFDVKVEDGNEDGSVPTSQTFHFNVTPVNDIASITGTYTGDVTEDGATQTASGALNVNDPDVGDGHFQTPASLAGTYGTFTFDPVSGAWAYALNNLAANVQGLHTGDTVHDTLVVTSNDGTATKTIDVSIHGANDTATITGTSTGSVTEDGTLTTNGSLTVNDVDTGDNHFQTPASLAGQHGTFGFDPGTGAWTYALNNLDADVQALNSGQFLHDTLTVTSADGSATKTIDVTINGTNDAPVHTTIADVGPYYAFSNNVYAASVSQPAAINFDADNIFGGGSDTFTFTFTQVYNSSGVNWLTVNAGQGTVSGDPTNLSSLTVYRIDAVDTVTHEHTFTYVAFSALPDSNSQYVQITSSASYNNPWMSDVVQVAAGSTVTTTITSASSSDVMIGNDDANKLDAQSGNDAIYGNGGDDYIYGGGNTAFLAGGSGNDHIYGGGDSKFLLGGAGDDYLEGGHDDVLMGGDGIDTIVAGTGQNLIVGGAGKDIITGNSGRDTYVFFEAGDDNVDKIYGVSTTTGDQNKDVFDLSYLLDNISTDKASHVRFMYSDAGHTTHVLTDPSVIPTFDGDVTIQVNTTGTWQSVATIVDQGNNLTTGNNTIQMMLDHATVQQFQA